MKYKQTHPDTHTHSRWYDTQLLFFKGRQAGRKWMKASALSALTYRYRQPLSHILIIYKTTLHKTACRHVHLCVWWQAYCCDGVKTEVMSLCMAVCLCADWRHSCVWLFTDVHCKVHMYKKKKKKSMCMFSDKQQLTWLMCLSLSMIWLMTGSGGFCLDSEPCGWTLFSPGPGNLQNIDTHIHYSYLN